MKTFQSIKYWLFDLDNTLYSGKTRVFEQVEKKMSKYVSDKLNVNIEAVSYTHLTLPTILLV